MMSLTAWAARARRPRGCNVATLLTRYVSTEKGKHYATPSIRERHQPQPGRGNHDLAAVDPFFQSAPPPSLRRLQMDEQMLADIIASGRHDGPLTAYTKLVASGQLQPDDAQHNCALALHGLWEALKANLQARASWQKAHSAWTQTHLAWREAVEEYEEALRKRSDMQASTSEAIAAENKSEEIELERPLEPIEPLAPVPPTHGCYIWGAVGVGKSLLMDLFAESCGQDSSLGLAVQRVHFHEFMHRVHRELHYLRQAGSEKTTATVARRIARETQLLAFDEFQITNISDALIIETLLDALFAEGVFAVMTSNRPPEDLYKDGLNRHLAIPQFLALLSRNGISFHELAASTDFRMVAVATADGPWRDYFCKSTGTEVDARLRSAFEEAAGTKEGVPRVVPIAWGRQLEVAKAAPGVGCFTFSQLCGDGDALSADDYLKLAATFDTLIVAGVPQFTVKYHNEARRFTNLVDCVYERHVRLIMSADVPPEELLTSMEVLATISLKRIDKPSRTGAAAALPSSSDGVRYNPFGPQPMDVADAVQRAATHSVGGKAGEDDSATGANVAGVMSGAVGSLQESGFAARRAISRLLHMQTEDYSRIHRQQRLRARSESVDHM